MLLINHDTRVYNALQSIRGLTNSDVYLKNKQLTKFGRNPNCPANQWTTIAFFQGASQYQETLVNTNQNLITHVVSSNANDTETYSLEYHTNDGNGNLTFGIQQYTLNGTTPVALTTPANRVSRSYPDLTTKNKLQGNVAVYEGAGATVTDGIVSPDEKIHLYVKGEDNGETDQKGQTSFSFEDWGLITRVYGSVHKSSKTATVDCRLVGSRVPDGVFFQFGSNITLVGGTGPVSFPLEPMLIIPPNFDVKLEAKSDTSNTEVSAGFGFYLATTAKQRPKFALSKHESVYIFS